MRKFKSVFIEITNRCNNNCSFCPGTRRPGLNMSIDLFARILSEIQGKTRFIHFHVLGEPLLHPEIKSLLTLSNEYSLPVNITTNGILLHENMTLLRSAPGLRQVNISLHWLSEVEDDIFIKEYLSSVFNFIRETGGREDFYITLRLWNLNTAGVNTKNKQILSAIETEFELSSPVLSSGLSYSGITLDKHVFLNQDMLFEWPRVKSADKRKMRFCKALRDQFAILVDGTVVPCCLDSEGVINLGNIHTASIDDILASQRSQRLYNGFSRRVAVEPLCMGCGYNSLY